MSGTTLVSGSLIVCVETVAEESSLFKIMEIVENAQASKAPIQRFADRLSGIFVPVILCLALLALCIWVPLSFYNPDMADDANESRFLFAFKFGISTLIIACPCALGLATPTAVMVATGMSANLGILIKGGEVLEQVSKITTIAFDKTGTLTEGNP